MDKYDLKTLLEKAAQAKDGKLDLSSDEDLSVALMNLISLEEHFFFTGAKTGKSEYYEMLNSIRSMRKDLLKKIIKDYEGEGWCICKHLLAASMRLIEVGTKHQGKGEKKEAADMFAKAYDLYSLFWGIALGLVALGDVKKVDEGSLSAHDKDHDSVFGKLGDLVKKVVNCCIE